MLSEAPKQSCTEPKPSQTGGFLSRFLRRFVAEAPGIQTIPQSKPSVIQPPLGLENFADQIQSVVDGRFAAERQKEHDIEVAKAAQIAASREADRKAAEALSKPYRDEEDRKYREKQEQIAKELADVLEKFRVVERLEYIRDTVWGGKGEIRPDDTYQFKDDYGTHTFRGGVKLVYQYLGVKLLDMPQVSGYAGIDSPSRPGNPHMQKYVPDTWSTTLSVSVLDIKQDSGEDQKLLSIASFRNLSSGYQTFQLDLESQRYPQFFGNFIPRETDGCEDLLEAALKQETIKRVDDGLLPSQLEESARKILTEAQRGPNWQKWKEVK